MLWGAEEGGGEKRKVWKGCRRRSMGCRSMGCGRGEEGGEKGGGREEEGDK